MAAQLFFKYGNVSIFRSPKSVVSITFLLCLFQIPKKIIGRKPKCKLKNSDAQTMIKAIVSLEANMMGLEKLWSSQRSLQRFANSEILPAKYVKPQGWTKDVQCTMIGQPVGPWSVCSTSVKLQ